MSGGGAVTGAAAGGRPARRVGVVGGGLAGLSAALDAADGGADVVLFESRPRLGGATWSFRRNGRSYDNGQHVFLRCCSAYRAFLDRLGVTALVDLQPRLDVPVLATGRRRTVTARLRRSRHLPAPFHLGPALANYGHVPRRERAGVLGAALALRRVDPDSTEADGRTFGDWLADHGQSPRTQAALWDLITRPTVNLPVEEASLATAAFVFQTGLLERPDAADLGWSRVPLGRLHGDAAAMALETRGAEVRLGQAVERVAPHEDGVDLVLASGETVPVDAAVVAVPHLDVGPLLPAGLLPRGVHPEHLGTSAVVNVYVAYDRAVTSHAVAAVVDSPVQWVFDHTRPSGAPDGQVLAVSLSAADDLLGVANDVLRDTVVGELGRILPGAAAARVVDTVVSRQGRATFRAAPGSRAHRPPAATDHPRVGVAGAWTDTGWPATMEGAVRSGRAAAAHALRATGTLRPLYEEVPA